MHTHDFTYNQDEAFPVIQEIIKGGFSMKKATDFRYNTGDTRVPWAAVGENYNAADLMEIIRFMMKGEGPEYEQACAAVYEQVKKLDAISTPPGKLTTGAQVEAAEEACNEYLGTTTSTFVTNATSGFEIAYKYANLKEGDEVIVPAITFVATMAYPLAVGAKLVFADVDPITINMDPADVARKITPKTKMIVPVHIGGYPVDMDPIMELAKKHDILVLEDAAHAFGAMYKGKKKLEDKGVTNIPHFGPLYRFKVVSDMGYNADEIAKECPVCEEVFYRRFTHLPLYGLSDEQLEYMADAVLEAVQEMKEGK